MKVHGADSMSPVAGRQRLRYLAVLAMVGIVLASCSPTSQSDPTGEPSETTATQTPSPESDTLAIATAAEPPSWSHLDGPTPPSAIFLNVIETLLEMAPDGSLQPLLAEFEASDDGREYLFHIREATFHDGSELTAADVVYSLESSIETRHPVVGGIFGVVEAIEKVDDQTVRVSLTRASQTFIRGMSGVGGAIIPEGSAEQQSTQPIGTGPYSFGEWREGAQVDLIRFDRYWGTAPHYSNIIWRFIPDERARLNALLAGEIDIAAQLSSTLRESDDIEAAGFSVRYQDLPDGPQFFHVVLNSNEEVFDDIRVRQAIAQAIDRALVAEGAVPDVGTPYCVLAPPKSVWGTDACPYATDPTAGVALLQDAGFEGLDLELKYNSSVAGSSEAAQVLASQLQQIGINLELVGLENTVYFEDVWQREDPRYQVALALAGNSIDDQRCPSLWTGDCYDEFDAILAAADESPDVTEWAELRQSAVKLHAERAYVIPMVALSVAWAQTTDIDGFTNTVFLPPTAFDLRSVHPSE